jgi:hypothetical protein
MLSQASRSHTPTTTAVDCMDCDFLLSVLSCPARSPPADRHCNSDKSKRAPHSLLISLSLLLATGAILVVVLLAKSRSSGIDGTSFRELLNEFY